VQQFQDLRTHTAALHHLIDVISRMPVIAAR